MDAAAQQEMRMCNTCCQLCSPTNRDRSCTRRNGPREGVVYGTVLSNLSNTTTQWNRAAAHLLPLTGTADSLLSGFSIHHLLSMKHRPNNLVSTRRRTALQVKIFPTHVLSPTVELKLKAISQNSDVTKAQSTRHFAVVTPRQIPSTP